MSTTPSAPPLEQPLAPPGPAGRASVAPTIPATSPLGLHVRAACNRILTILFLTALLIPLIGTWAQWDFAFSAEKRVLADAPPPPASLADAIQWPSRFFAFFDDHFGLRQTLIRENNALQEAIGLAHTSKVLIGKGDWLFLRLFDPDPSFFYERKLSPMTEADLDLWQTVLEKRQAYMARLKIPYLIVVAPEKQTIYPEYLPDSLTPIGPSRLNQLIYRLQSTHSPVVLLDLRQILLWAKTEPNRINPDLYIHTDTHWNDDGAYYGYQAIMTALGQLAPDRHLAAQPRSDFFSYYRGWHSGDLIALLGLQDFHAERVPNLTRHTAVHATRIAGDNDFFESTVADRSLPRLLMFHDSFGRALVRFFIPHFSHTLMPRDRRLLPEVIAQDHPDFVINEFVERELNWIPPEDPPEITNTPLAPHLLAN